MPVVVVGRLPARAVSKKFLDAPCLDVFWTFFGRCPFFGGGAGSEICESLERDGQKHTSKKAFWTPPGRGPEPQGPGLQGAPESNSVSSYGGGRGLTPKQIVMHFIGTHFLDRDPTPPEPSHFHRPTSRAAPGGRGSGRGVGGLRWSGVASHEEHVKEGLQKRDALIAEGHATAARIVREAEAQHKADMSRLEQEKALAENDVDRLRSFEREYRAKLKSYIEGQLSDLEATASSAKPATAPTAIANNTIQI